MWGGSSKSYDNGTTAVALSIGTAPVTKADVAQRTFQLTGDAAARVKTMVDVFGPALPISDAQEVADRSLDAAVFSVSTFVIKVHANDVTLAYVKLVCTANEDKSATVVVSGMQLSMALNPVKETKTCTVIKKKGMFGNVVSRREEWHTHRSSRGFTKAEIDSILERLNVEMGKLLDMQTTQEQVPKLQLAEASA